MGFNPTKDAVEGFVGGIMGGLDDLFTSDEERENARLKAMELAQQPHILQALANIEEAKHKSWFVAGWRPAIGWVCAAGLGYHFLIFPFARMIAALVSPDIALPEMQAAELTTMTMALLGLGGFRTYEKTKGVQNQH